MTSMYDVLRASKGLPVDDIFAELWGRKLSGDYTIVTYTGTLPAVLTGTKAGYLHRYKIYGNTEQNGTPTPENPIEPSECGERTGNIWTLTATDFSESTVVVGAAKEVTITGLTPNTRYTLSSNIRKTDDDASCLWFNGTSSRTNGVWDGQSRTATSSANGELKVYYRSTILPEFDNYWYMLNSGSTAFPYEPYGYKLPLASAGQSVDIYLGGDTLSAEEYIDSGTGKIYRMVSGVLTPTDPPIPFPQIPTSTGSTTISWAGSGLAPSEVEFEYERRR